MTLWFVIHLVFGLHWEIVSCDCSTHHDNCDSLTWQQGDIPLVLHNFKIAMFCLEDTQQCAVEIKLLDCYKPEFLYANFWSESRPWMVYYNAVMIPKAIYMSLYMCQSGQVIIWPWMIHTSEPLVILGMNHITSITFIYLLCNTMC